MRAPVIPLAFLCVCVAFTQVARADFETDCANFKPEKLREKTVRLTIGKKRVKIKAEVARTNKEKARGLMCRKNLRDGNAMLFIYNRPQTGGFWMFNTYVDLDILYIAKNGGVIGKAEMKKCPRGEGENLRKWQKRCVAEARAYLPPAPYTAALELPAGYLERNGFERGAVTISFPGRE